MFKSRFAYLLTSACLTAGLVAVASPASAEILVSHDGAGDVAEFRADCVPAEEKCASPAPGNKFADIRKFSSEFRENAVLLRTTVRQLPRRGDGTLHLIWRVKTAQGHQAIEVAVRNRNFVTNQRSGSPCAINNMRAGIAPDMNMVRISFDSKCLRGADWMRTASVAHLLRKDGPSWRDDARAPLELNFPASHRPAFGPRITVG